MKSINIMQIEIAICYWRKLASAAGDSPLERAEYGSIAQTLADLYRGMVTERRTMIAVGDLSARERAALAMVCRLTEAVPEEA